MLNNPGAPPSHGPRPIILVETDPVARKVLSSRLQPVADRVPLIALSTAKDLTEHMPNPTSPYLVVLGLGHCVERGLTQIHELRGLACVGRILVLASHLDDVVATTYLYAGAAGSLPKTLSTTELLAAIMAVEQGLTVLSPEFGKARPSTASLIHQSDLSGNELIVLHGLAAGNTNRELAKALGLSESSAKAYVKHLMAKFHEPNRIALGLAARTIGL